MRVQVPADTNSYLGVNTIQGSLLEAGVIITLYYRKCRSMYVHVLQHLYSTNYTDVALLIKNRAKARVCVDREVARATPTPPTPPPPYMHMQADTLLPALK